jgi:heat shock protein HslJ
MQTPEILVALAMAVELVLGGCTSSPNTLADTRWSLVDLNGQSVGSHPQVTLNFEDSTINGRDGCNSYSTTYTVKGGKFSLNKNMAATMMACPEPIMQQAAAYITALTQAAAHKIDGRQLTLLNASGKVLATFTRQGSELGGTSWIATGCNNGRQAVVSIVIGSKLTADFSIDGKLSGSAGCNNYIATYEASGKNLKIGTAASTRKSCSDPAGLMEQEMQFLKALQAAATYHLEGNQLNLRTADGALSVTFVRTGTAVTSSTHAQQKGASIAWALPNAEYPVDNTSTGKAQLKWGVFEESVAPGSATSTKVRLGKVQSFGDVNGDGAEDAAVTLVVDPGGSGTFTYLAAVINENGTAKPVSSILLGDRIVVKSLEMNAGTVVVTILTRKPDEEMSMEPKFEVTRTFKLQSDKLVEVK